SRDWSSDVCSSDLFSPLPRVCFCVGAYVHSSRLGGDMNYNFQYREIWQNWDQLLNGVVTTLQLSASAMVIGLAIAIICAVLRMTSSKSLGWLVTFYVELIRNTPLLVQGFLIFFGLPWLGLRLDSNTAALIALSVNVGAYATEIVRAGLESVSRGQIEAGQALG